MSQNSLLLLQNRILIVQQPGLIDRQRQSRQTCDGSGKAKQNKKEKTHRYPPTWDAAQFPRTMLLSQAWLGPWGSEVPGSMGLPHLMHLRQGFPTSHRAGEGYSAVQGNAKHQVVSFLYCMRRNPKLNQHRQGQCNCCKKMDVSKAPGLPPCPSPQPSSACSAELQGDRSSK